MSKIDELYRLHRLLDGRRTGISRATLTRDHGFSRSTLSRLIADLRDKLGAPLIHDKDRNGYHYDTADGRHLLPGLWFSADELLALVTLKHLLTHLEPGLLDDHLRPLQARIDQLLESNHLGAGEAAQRIRLLSIASRRKNPRHFQAVAHAVLQRHRLKIDYYNRERDQISQREISPSASPTTATTGISMPGATTKKACASSPLNASAPSSRLPSPPKLSPNPP